VCCSRVRLRSVRVYVMRVTSVCLCFVAFVVLNLHRLAPEKRILHSQEDSILIRELEENGQFDCTLRPGNKSFVRLTAGAPSLAIIGTAKGGTTDVFELVVRAFPAMRRPLDKETWRLIKPSPFGSKPHLKYLHHLQHPCAKSNGSTLRECLSTSAVFTVDATPAYLHWSAFPQRLLELSPNTKVVIMLRDPLQRALSLFNHWKVNGQGFHSNETFENCANLFWEWTASPRGRSFIDGVSKTTTLLDMQQVYQQHEHNKVQPMHVGLFNSAFYPYQIANWLAGFLNPGNVLIIDSHQYYLQSREDNAHMLSHFLFGRPATPPEIARVSSLAVQNAKLHVGIKAYWGAPNSRYRCKAAVFLCSTCAKAHGGIVVHEERGF
jgi:hypothetical protein